MTICVRQLMYAYPCHGSYLLRNLPYTELAQFVHVMEPLDK